MRKARRNQAAGVSCESNNPVTASRRPPCPPLENPSFALVRIYYTALAILSSRGKAKERDTVLIGLAP